MPDYNKIKLTRKTPQAVSDEDTKQELETILKSRANYKARGKNAVAQDGDMVSLTYKLVDKNKKEETKQIRFELGAMNYIEFFDTVRGMKVGETKNTDIKYSHNSEEADPRKKSFELSLSQLETIHLPELDNKLFQELNVKDLEELKTRIRETTEKQRQDEIQQDYRSGIRSQLSNLFNEFDLPEKLIIQKEQDLEKKIDEHSRKEKPDNQELNKEEEMESFRENLRLNYIIDAIGNLEAVPFNQDIATGEFINLASMFNQSPDELIQTPFGNSMFNQIVSRQHQEAVLDRIVARTFGDPIEKKEESGGKDTGSKVEEIA